MTPEQVAASYDRIADRWLDLSTYGFAQLERVEVAPSRDHYPECEVAVLEPR